MKYKLLIAVMFFNILLIAQQSFLGGNNIVTIIGDSIRINNLETKSIYGTKSPSNSQNISALASENGSLSFENEFTSKNDLQSRINKETTSASSTNNREYSKLKKRKTSLVEMRFNVKKRFRTWIPKPKKKYRPNICEKI